MIFHTRIPFLFWLFAIALVAITAHLVQIGAQIPDVILWAWGVTLIIIGLANIRNAR